MVGVCKNGNPDQCLPIIKLFCMKIILVLIILAQQTYSLTSQAEPCICLNNGQCSSSKGTSRCLCPPHFIGESCDLAAQQIDNQYITAELNTNYSYFYFQPNQVNYYKLIFNICMLSNPSQSHSLFYIETERNDGSLRTTPSLFETAKLVLNDQACTTFSTHYISVKRREDDSFRKIVIGLKVMESEQNDKYLNVYPNKGQIDSLKQSKINQAGEKVQHISLKMSYQVYIQTSYYGTFVILFTSFVLLLILTSFITYLRRRYSLQSIQMDSLQLANFQNQLNRSRRFNPQQFYDRYRRNNLTNIEIFMPVTRYGISDSIFIPEILSNKESEMQAKSDHDKQSCSICLLDFANEDQIRTTPCRHRYHRECIDSWCQSKMSCPICRRNLDFTQQIRRIYYEFLRNQLNL